MAVRLSALRAGRLYPLGKFLVRISFRGWVDPKTRVRLEGLDKLIKNPPHRDSFRPVAYEGVWGGWCINPHFLFLGTNWSLVVSFTPRGKSPRYPFDRLGGSQSRSGRHVEEKILDRTGTWTSTPRSSSQSLYLLLITLGRRLLYGRWWAFLPSRNLLPRLTQTLS
jgi:hypothetical protein